MNKSELVAKVAEATGLTKKNIEASLNATLGAIQETLVEGDKVVLTGFGTFEVRNRKARKGHDPRTNKPIDIPAQKTPAFKAGKVLKQAVK